MWLPGVICGVRGNGKQLTVRLDEVVGPGVASVLELLPSEHELKSFAGLQRSVDLTDMAVLEALNTKNTSVEVEETKPSLPLQNTSDSANGFEDMILIDHLHEASILYNLRRRFFQQLPCTVCVCRGFIRCVIVGFLLTRLTDVLYVMVNMLFLVWLHCFVALSAF